MSPLTILIIDDEAPARSLLKEYIGAFQQLKIAGECRNGVEAIALINTIKPDIILLDIQMPGKSGFEVLQEIEWIPKIIFSTAYDEFALQAFEVSAVDYLLKPYTKERFNRAINKILAEGSANLQLVQHLTETLNPLQYPVRLFAQAGTKLINIPVADIQWIEADGDYTHIHTLTQSYLGNKSMKELEEKLNPSFFQRVHRSAIVSIAAIKELRREETRQIIVLQNGDTVKISRSYQDAVKKIKDV